MCVCIQRECVHMRTHSHLWMCIYSFTSGPQFFSSREGTQRLSSQPEAVGAVCVHMPVSGLCSHVCMYNVHVLCAHVPVGNTSSASLLEPHFGITEIAEEKPGQNTYMLIFTGPVHSACAVSQSKNNPDTKLDPCCCHQLISQGYSYHA